MTEGSNEAAAEPTPNGAEEPRAAAEQPMGVEEPKSPGRRRLEGAGSRVRRFRTRLASVLWLVAVTFALFLAAAALAVALKLNQDNAIVAFVIDIANAVDFGVFKEFTGKDEEANQIRGALVNYGIAAVLWLVIGKIADRGIRPS